MISKSKTSKTGKVTLLTLYEALAETSTLQSATNNSVRCNFSKASEAWALMILCVAFSPWNTDTIIRSIGQRAYQAKYEGEWERIQQVLESYDFNDKTENLLDRLTFFCREVLTKVLSPEEVFGNYIPLAYRMLKVLIRFKRPEQTGKVIRPQFRRGYRDKGSRRLPHERLPEGPFNYLEPRIDRRGKILHPFIFRGDVEEQD